MRMPTWRTVAICALLLPAALQAQASPEAPAAVQAPHTPDAPLLSNEQVPPPPPLPISGALPDVSTLPGVAATAAEAVPAPPLPMSFQPPATAVMPPPPPSPMTPPPPPGLALPTAPDVPATPLPGLPVLAPPPTPAVSAADSSAIVLTPEQAAVLRKLSRSLVALRRLVDEPRSNEALGRVLDSGKSCAALLGLGAFPVMPRFEARSDETVVRDRSYDAWEYRKFGAFQTRLDGRIRPIAGHVHADLAFRARGKSGVIVKGSMTQAGPLDGTLAIEGCDAWGRPWKMALTMSGLILRDDGIPSGGTLSLSGSDPSGNSRAGHLTFPIADPVPQAAQKGRRRNQGPPRRY